MRAEAMEPLALADRLISTSRQNVLEVVVVRDAPLEARLFSYAAARAVQAKSARPLQVTLPSEYSTVRFLLSTS
jgi:hypothetical protein